MEGGGSIGDFFGGIQSKLTSGIDRVQNSAADAIELTAIQSAGFPVSIATWIQGQRRTFGFAPFTPGSSGLYIAIIVLGIAATAFAALIYQIVMKIINFLANGFTGGLRTKSSVILFSLLCGFVISYFIYVYWVAPYLTKNKIDIAKAAANSLAVLQGFQNQPAAQSDTTLLNIQALAVKQIAYIGPTAEMGNFDVETGVQSTLRTGIRFFHFQISYLDAKKSGFDAPYVPTLIYRKESGELTSVNGANIGKVASMLATYAFSPEMPNSNHPLIVYLHFQRAPNSLRTPEKYVKFMSDVAKFLEPLYPFTISSSPEGSFQRQQNEKLLLSTPLSNFQKKVIFMTNADTSIFRNLSKYGMNNISPQNDLDYLVGVRVYLEDERDKIGITTTTGGPPPSAVLIPFRRLEKLTAAKQDDFAMKHKNTFVITMTSQTENPSKDSIVAALNHLGVNCIPLNLFGEAASSIKAKMSLWSGDPLYKSKPAAYMSAVGFIST